MDTEHATNVTSRRCFSKQGRAMEAEQVDWDKINNDLRLENMDFEGVLGKPLLKCDEIYSTAMPMRFLGNYEENHMIDAESNGILPSAVMSGIEIGGSSDYGLGRTAASISTGTISSSDGSHELAQLHTGNSQDIPIFMNMSTAQASIAQSGNSSRSQEGYLEKLPRGASIHPTFKRISSRDGGPKSGRRRRNSKTRIRGHQHLKVGGDITPERC
jgi:hypothetical protein